MNKPKFLEKVYRYITRNQKEEPVKIQPITNQRVIINEEITTLVEQPSPFSIVPTKKFNIDQIIAFQENVSLKVIMESFRYKIYMQSLNSNLENKIALTLPLIDLHEINTAFFVYYPEIIQDFQEIVNTYRNQTICQNNNFNKGHLNQHLTTCLEKIYGLETNPKYFEEFLRFTLVFIEKSIENSQHFPQLTSDAQTINTLFNTKQIPKNILKLGLELLTSRSYNELLSSQEDFQNFTKEIGKK